MVLGLTSRSEALPQRSSVKVAPPALPCALPNQPAPVCASAALHHTCAVLRALYDVACTCLVHGRRGRRVRRAQPPAAPAPPPARPGGQPGLNRLLILTRSWGKWKKWLMKSKAMYLLLSEKMWKGAFQIQFDGFCLLKG